MDHVAQFYCSPPSCISCRSVKLVGFNLTDATPPQPLKATLCAHIMLPYHLYRPHLSSAERADCFVRDVGDGEGPNSLQPNSCRAAETPHACTPARPC